MVLTLLRVDGLHGNFGWTINILFNFLSIRKIIDYRKVNIFGGKTSNKLKIASTLHVISGSKLQRCVNLLMSVQF